jgi:hypothetical protein
MADINHVPVLSGQTSVAWGARGASDVDSLLFINQDLNNTIWLGQQSIITPGGPGTIPLLPNATFSGNANTPWYVIGSAADIQPLVVVPNGQAFFLGLTAGMGSLVIPSIQSPNFITGISGWQIRKDGSAEFNNITIRGGETIGGTTLGYNGTPALGNMALSISITGGTDSFGNVFRPGIWIYGVNGSQAGLETNSGDAGVVLQPPNSTHLTADPQLIGSNASAGLPNETEWALISSGIANGGQQAEMAAISEAADGSSAAAVWAIFNGVTPAMVITQNALTYTGAIVLQQLATPANVIGSGQWFANANGNPAGQTSAGLAGTVPLSQTDLTTHSVGNTAVAGLITRAWNVPAGDGSGGTAYTIKALASLVIGQTTAETITIGLAINGIGGTLVPLATLGAAFNSSTLSAGYDIPIEMTLIVDAAGVNIPQIYSDGPLGITTANRLATSSANMSGHNNGSSFVKGNANTLAIYAQWGGAGGSVQTIGTIASRFYREGN